MPGVYLDNALLYKKCRSTLIKHPKNVQFVFGEGADVVKIPANRAALCTASPVFKDLFNGELKRKDNVKMTDASPEAFREFLQFSYDPQVFLTKGNIAGVLKLAKKYGVTDCLPICSNFLVNNTNRNEVLWALHLAIEFNLNDLKKSLLQFIRQNWKFVFNMIKFDNGKYSLASAIRRAPVNQLLDSELEALMPHVLFAVSERNFLPANQSILVSFGQSLTELFQVIGFAVFVFLLYLILIVFIDKIKREGPSAY